MLEAGNTNHRKILSDVRSAEGIMRKFCQSLPADRLLNSCEPENLTFEEGSDRVYIEPESGAKLTFTSAMQIVGHYVGSLVGDDSLGIHTVLILFSLMMARMLHLRFIIFARLGLRAMFVNYFYQLVRPLRVLKVLSWLPKQGQRELLRLKHVYS